MIVFGCLGLAVRYVWNAKREIRILEELRDILELMEGEIRYGLMPLPECFLKVGESRRSDLGKCFTEIGRRALTSSREDIRSLMEDELRTVLKNVLRRENYLSLFDFLSPAGFAEDELQRRALERSRNRIETLLKERAEDVKGRCRVAWSLGITGGVFVTLFLW